MHGKDKTRLTGLDFTEKRWKLSLGRRERSSRLAEWCILMNAEAESVRVVGGHSCVAFDEKSTRCPWSREGSATDQR